MKLLTKIFSGKIFVTTENAGAVGAQLAAPSCNAIEAAKS
jgi:hypothetical protein